MSINGLFGAAIFLIGAVSFIQHEDGEVPAAICLVVAILSLVYG